MYPILHTKFQGHRSVGSEKEDFFKFSPFVGKGGMLVMSPKPFEKLVFPEGLGGCI